MISGKDQEDKAALSLYDFPLCMNLIRKIDCFRFIPICPTFNGWRCTTEKAETGVEVIGNEEKGNIMQNNSQKADDSNTRLMVVTKL